MKHAFPLPKKKFVFQILNLIRKHASDPDFSVPELCRLAGISRSHLHRKLLRNTLTSAIRIILAFRLANARKLLMTTELNISEIAYECGFNNPNYFTRVFSKKMGCCPTEYRRRAPTLNRG